MVRPERVELSRRYKNLPSASIRGHAFNIESTTPFKARHLCATCSKFGGIEAKKSYDQDDVSGCRDAGR